MRPRLERDINYPTASSGSLLPQSDRRTGANVAMRKRRLTI
jgi:hypothetical protein